MLEGEWGREAPPLAQLVENAGARLTGLRLTDGSLVLKFENRWAEAQVRVRSAAIEISAHWCRGT